MSQQAKKLIAQAQAEKWTRLDLGNCELTDLDTQVPELFELTHLEELVLSNKWWEWIEEEKNWEEKQSQNTGEANKLNKLPQGIGLLKKLRVLICGGNFFNAWSITDLSPLSGLVNLTVLYLRENQITDLSSLSGLVNLTQLDLKRNQITDLSPLLPFLQRKEMPLQLKRREMSREEEINVKDNPLQIPPVEIVRQGREAVLRYFAALEKSEGKWL